MNFSPYQPPPDVPADDPPNESSARAKGKGKKPWFTRGDSAAYANSYQAGGSSSDPTAAAQAYGNDPEDADVYGYGNGGGSSSYSGGGGLGGAEEGRINAWESRFGWRIDAMAAAAYLGGPITAVLFLIIETHNDYVRFHAYQSALLTTPIVIFLLLTNLLLPLPAFLKTLIILGGIGVTLYTAYRAWKDAQDGLNRYWLPYIGEIAERWVGEE